MEQTHNFDQMRMHGYISHFSIHKWINCDILASANGLKWHTRCQDVGNYYKAIVHVYYKSPAEKVSTATCMIVSSIPPANGLTEN